MTRNGRGKMRFDELRRAFLENAARSGEARPDAEPLSLIESLTAAPAARRRPAREGQNNKPR